jgi:hypothetical protein
MEDNKMSELDSEIEYTRRLIDKINNVIDRETADLKYNEQCGDEFAADNSRRIIATLKKRLEHFESVLEELELKNIR